MLTPTGIDSPTRLWSRAEVLSRPSPVPNEPGVYGWYFRSLPGDVPTDECITFADATLLYVGISPKAPPKNGRPPSRQSLRRRIRYHFRGNAYGSTLRLTLGVLLSSALGIELRRVGSTGSRLTFTKTGEQRLSEWMGEHAGVTWVAHPEPWLLESETIDRLSLPLNLSQNSRHPFYATLSQLRRKARERARSGPIAE